MENMKNKIVGIFVFMLLITTCVIPVYGFESQSNVKKSSILEIPDSYVIENVPYVSQGDTYYCYYASITMIFQYYRINASLFEVLFNSGIGYSGAYKILYPCLNFAANGISMTVKDRQFLSEIYGLNYSRWSCNDKSISDDSKWQMYWTYVKENISKNIPVTTIVMMENLPYIPPEPPLDHMIVLVGYNQTNGTVCVHDPYAGVVNASLSGAYIFIPIECIRKTISNFSYFFEKFEDTSNEPLSKEEAFELAHSRNIQKMKGDSNAYDKDELNTIQGNRKTLIFFGVNSLKFLKRSYNIGNLLMMKIVGTYDIVNSYSSVMFYIPYEGKHNMSQYLIENADMYPNGFFEANMLDIEANNWLLLYFKNIELFSIPNFRLSSKILVLKEIRDILDVIISIEEDIITGPSSIVSS